MGRSGGGEQLETAVCEQAVCGALALILEEPGSQIQCKMRGELAGQVHQNQETKRPGGYIGMIEREAKGHGGRSGGFS